MIGDTFDEPGKHWSAVQAAVIMALLAAPMMWSLSFSRTLAPAPLTVAIVAAPPPPEPEPEPLPDQQEAEQVAQEVHEAVERQRAAELARRQERRREREEELRRREEEQVARAAEVKERLLEQERERQRRLDEEKRRRDEERREREERERRERERQEEAERAEQRRLEAERTAEAERQAKLKAAANKVVMNRFITGIHDQVQRHVSEPHGVPRGIKAEYRISIGPNGHLRVAPVLRAGSGNEIFDEAALRAIVRSGQDGFALPDDPDLQREFEDIVIVIVAGSADVRQ